MESAEHIWIGDQIGLQHAAGKEPARRTTILKISDKEYPCSLRYGQIIALAGDFYGVVGGPISMAADQEEAFRQAWGTLARPDPGQLHEILEIMAEEIAALDKVIEENKDVKPGSKGWKEPSLVYAELADSLSHRWNGATGGSYKEWVPPGRYLELAAENFDHFGLMARTAYQVGHRVAMQHAVLASQQPSEKDRRTMLDIAYAMNAFADHFLSDLFSAGHLRVPRKELYDRFSPAGPVGKIISGALVRDMHNEDCWYGLSVRNAAGDNWTAYGDTRLLDSVSERNRTLVVQAVQFSADDVWRAYQGLEHRESALALVPDVQELMKEESAENHRNSSPVFRFQSPDVVRRIYLENRSSYTWTDYWNPMDTIFWFYRRGALATKTQYVHAECYTRDGTFAGWLWSDKWGNARLARNEADAHGVAWYTGDDGFYLQKDTDDGDRYLGLGNRSYASWGLKRSAYTCPVYYNPDQTISLASEPTRWLFLDNDDWLSWTAPGAVNPNILKVKLPVPGSPYTG